MSFLDYIKDESISSLVSSFVSSQILSTIYANFGCSVVYGTVSELWYDFRLMPLMSSNVMTLVSPKSLTLLRCLSEPDDDIGNI